MPSSAVNGHPGTEYSPTLGMLHAHRLHADSAMAGPLENDEVRESVM